MTSMNEITRLLGRWLSEHRIAGPGFTLTLNFIDRDSAERFDEALQAELAQTSFYAPLGLGTLDLRSFKMNGIAVRVESPVHETRRLPMDACERDGD
jgi:hypothetical protein